MASVEDVISTMDPEKIKRKRSSIQGMMTINRNNLTRLLVKTAGKFDHVNIHRIRVEGEFTCLRDNLEKFKMIHEALEANHFTSTKEEMKLKFKGKMP